MEPNLKINPVLTVVMDGIGVNNRDFGNAVKLARTPYLDYLKNLGCYTELAAHGTLVGLPTDDDMGNSEVGHNVIGAGKVFDQGALLCNNSIESGQIFKSKAWTSAIQHITSSGGALHLLGLLSDGNVHSHENHIYALMDQAVKENVSKIRLHVLLDGRDVSAKSAEVYISRLNEQIKKHNASGVEILVASGGGRMTTTMDRYEADWSMVERGWKAHVLGEAEYYFKSLDEAIAFFRKDESLTDQYLPSFVIKREDKAVGKVEDSDSVILCNFRGDRAIEISKAFDDDEFTFFDRVRHPKCFFAGIMEYDGDLKIPKNCLVVPPEIKGTLGEKLALKGVTQFACSETQKFGHVTYFWNGNKSGYFDENLEEYLEVPSDDVPFHLKPWMKAYEICNETISRMQSKTFQFGRINFANGDMVGHSGDLEASVIAVATVDAMIGRLIKACDQYGYTLMVTADHGNCDEMFDEKMESIEKSFLIPKSKRPKPKTSHTLNPVPFYIYEPMGNRSFNLNSINQASLGNIAGTIWKMLGLGENKEFLPSLIQ